MSEEKYKILIVDDEQEHREWYGEIFEDEGHEVQLAEDGLNALGILKQEFLPDCIVTDVNMPRMDGLEFCKRIKEEMRYRDIPIVMVTGNMQPEDEEKGYAQGISLYIKKTTIQTDQNLYLPVISCCKDRKEVLKILKRLHKTGDMVKDLTIKERADQLAISLFFKYFNKNKDELAQYIYQTLRDKMQIGGAIYVIAGSHKSKFYTDGSDLLPDMILPYLKKGNGIYNKEPFTVIVGVKMAFMSVDFPNDPKRNKLMAEIVKSFIDMFEKWF